MKYLIWLLLFALYAYDVFCDDDLLSKFHQNGYKLKDVRMDLLSYNEKYFNFFELKTFKYNRTTPAVNATFNMKISVGDKLEVLVQGYKFLSNEFRRITIRFQVNLRKAFESNVIGLKRMKRCGNITTAYFEKDITYHFCNFVIDETHLPPLIPTGIFKAVSKLLYLNEEIAVISCIAEVYTPIAYPKK